MAITVATLENSFSASDLSVYTTGLVTSGANKLLTLGVINHHYGSGGAPATATAVLVGRTLVEIGNTVFSTDGTDPTGRITLFRGLGASSVGPLTTAITLSRDAKSCIWFIQEWDGMDTSGTNGSGAIVQYATNQAQGGNPAALTVTLSALADAVNNVVFAAFANDAAGAATPGTGYTELGDVASGEDVNAECEWKLPGTTTPNAGGMPAFAYVGGISIEIAVASAGGATRPVKMAGVWGGYAGLGGGFAG